MKVIVIDDNSELRDVAEKLNIPFETLELEFARKTEESVLLQLKSRNIPEDVFFEKKESYVSKQKRLPNFLKR
jgi:formyltetrahydrofolate hydrolase